MQTNDEAVAPDRPHPRDFFLAIRHRDADEVERLLRRVADPNWETRGGDETALASTVDVVRVLLAHGATDHGHMPLMSAVSWNRTDGNPDTAAIAWLLLEDGGDVNRADETGQTPLREAIAARDVATIKLFLEHGAVVDAESLRGALASNHEEIIALVKAAMA